MSNNDIDTDTETTAEPAETVEQTDTPTDLEPQTDTDAEGADDNGSGNREAAKYRRRLRDTETERDELAARLESMQRAEAERLAGSTLHKPAGLWANGATVADVLDDSGNVDADRVKATAETARDALGLQARRPANYVPREGGNPRPTGGGASMRDVVMGRNR